MFSIYSVIISQHRICHIPKLFLPSYFWVSILSSLALHNLINTLALGLPTQHPHSTFTCCKLSTSEGGQGFPTAQPINCKARGQGWPVQGITEPWKGQSSLIYSTVMLCGMHEAFQCSFQFYSDNVCNE